MNLKGLPSGPVMVSIMGLKFMSPAKDICCGEDRKRREEKRRKDKG